MHILHIHVVYAAREDALGDFKEMVGDEDCPVIAADEEALTITMRHPETVLTSDAAISALSQTSDEPGLPRDWDHDTLEAFVENNYWHNPEDAIGDIRLWISQHKNAQLRMQ